MYIRDNFSLLRKALQFLFGFVLFCHVSARITFSLEIDRKCWRYTNCRFFFLPRQGSNVYLFLVLVLSLLCNTFNRDRWENGRRFWVLCWEKYTLKWETFGIILIGAYTQHFRENILLNSLRRVVYFLSLFVGSIVAFDINVQEVDWESFLCGKLNAFYIVKSLYMISNFVSHCD